MLVLSLAFLVTYDLAHLLLDLIHYFIRQLFDLSFDRVLDGDVSGLEVERVSFGLLVVELLVHPRCRIAGVRNHDRAQLMLVVVHVLHREEVLLLFEIIDFGAVLGVLILCSDLALAVL